MTKPDFAASDAVVAAAETVPDDSVALVDLAFGSDIPSALAAGPQSWTETPVDLGLSV